MFRAVISVVTENNVSVSEYISEYSRFFGPQFQISDVSEVTEIRMFRTATVHHTPGGSGSEGFSDRSWSRSRF